MRSLSLSTLRNALFVAVIALGSSVATAYQPVGTLLSATGLADPVRQPTANGSMDDFQDGSDAASNAQTPGNVSELKQMMVRAHKLTELRVTYNSKYGAALFFYPQDMVYYVALFQAKNFWRVVKSQDDTRAETVYAQFARKSYALAEGEIKRTQLQAQKALLERVIAISNDQAQRLTANLSIARAGKQSVVTSAADAGGIGSIAERKIRRRAQVAHVAAAGSTTPGSERSQTRTVALALDLAMGPDDNAATKRPFQLSRWNGL